MTAFATVWLVDSGKAIEASILVVSWMIIGSIADDHVNLEKEKGGRHERKFRYNYNPA